MRKTSHVALFALTMLVAAACGGNKESASKAPPKPADGSPLSFEFVKLSGEGKRMAADFKVFNHTDKEVRGAQLRLHYLDDAGKELKTFPWGVVKSPLVGKNGSSTISAGAFMPPATKSVTITLRRVEFSDGTKWKRADSAAPAKSKPATTTPPATGK